MPCFHDRVSLLAIASAMLYMEWEGALCAFPLAGAIAFRFLAFRRLCLIIRWPLCLWNALFVVYAAVSVSPAVYSCLGVRDESRCVCVVGLWGAGSAWHSDRRALFAPLLTRLFTILH